MDHSENEKLNNEPEKADVKDSPAPDKNKKLKLFKIILIAGWLLVAVAGLCAWQISGVQYSATAAVYDTKDTVRALAALDYATADAELESLQTAVSDLERRLDNPFWKTVGFVFRRDVGSARLLVSVLDRAEDSLFAPAAEFIRTDAAGGSVSAEALLELYDKLMPEVKSLAGELEGVSFRFYDRDGQLQGYIDMLRYFARVLDLADEDFVKPAVELLAAYPVSEIKTEDSWNFEALGRYLDFLSGSAPKLAGTIKSISSEELAKVDPYGKLASLCGSMSSLADFASALAADVAAPAAEVLQSQPLSGLTVDGGFNAALIGSYAELLEKILPRTRELIQEFYGIDLGSIDKEGKITALVDKINSVLEKYEPAEEYLPLLKVLMGNGEDRTYVFPVQNSSEIRASGGFPGSVGLILIRDGVLSFSDFAGVHSFFYMYCSKRYNITDEEKDIFSGNMYLTWDACYCPNYERVGQIYAYAAEDKFKITVDGSISMTPSILQDVLKIFGDITLSDGTVLTGDNATKAVQYDVYFRYYPYGSTNNLYAADSFFGDCARSAMELVKSNIDKDTVLDLVELFRAGTEDRRIMLWMADEEEEEIVRAAGCSGGLNHDRNNPQAGIYTSGFNACKLGWWLGITPAVSEPVINEDGSRTYDITVTVENTLTWNEYNQVSVDFVTAASGTYSLFTHFFAPEGGTISDFTCSRNDWWKKSYTYDGLQGIRATYYLGPGGSVTFSYKITTAPGVETPLGLSMTPTLQQYW